LKQLLNCTGEEQALSALSQILIRCSAYRYDVLEVFSVGEVFLAQPGTNEKNMDIQWYVVDILRCCENSSVNPQGNSYRYLCLDVINHTIWM
jgi:hypothetical protein